MSERSSASLNRFSYSWGTILLVSHDFVSQTLDLKVEVPW